MAKPAPTSDRFPRKFGKYHLLAPLAQGGMGALYLAVTGDKGLERLLCIKTVLPHLADKEYVARFRDEAKIVVQLSHGNLIPVFDAGQVAGELFLAMEFVKGKDLRAVWNRCAKKGVAFPIDVAVYVTKELCRGLGYAHGFGDIKLVHRDVSPPNVLLSYAGEVKLTDFGLASSTLKMEKTLPGIIYGKVAYMSPEQARGEKLDGRSDVYAAGIILWELLTGRQLFPPGKEQPQDLLKRARDPNVEAPSTRAPRVPTDLDSIVLRALGSDPNNRYKKAEEFRDALGAWLATNSPSTDADRLETFIGDLFSEDIIEEEEDRVVLMETTRERVRTLPPTDELRRLLEATGGMDGLAKKVDRRQLAEASAIKRRALDIEDDAQDRRGGGGRRIVDAIDRTKRGVAVDVSPPRADGATVIGTSSNPATAPTQLGLATAAAAAELEESVAPDDVLGQVLDNRYRVSSLLGEGGMGRVYLAEHVDIGKLVAVKILHPVYSRMPDLVERFRREARAASKIGHPNIVDVTDSGTTRDGSVYFVMEYLEGVELAGIIDREGAIDIRRALGISTQICRALSAAHAAGIIHRDLKPENVFLTSREGTSDFVKVLDFGIAKSSEAEEARNKKLTHPGMAMGTPEYMAPEQAAGKHADERCDVYAVGAILYEMLTGTPPYDGENFMEILTKKATQEPTPPRQLRAEIPEIVEALLMQAMAREPDHRPPSMEAFEYELTKCFAGRSVAVANILGISPDLAYRPGTHDDIGRRESTEFGIEGTGLRSQSGVRPVEPSVTEDTEAIPDVRGGGRRAFGWLLLLGLVVGAAGIVVYVAKGEKSAASSSPAAALAEDSPVPDKEVPAPKETKPSPMTEPKDDKGKDKPESANNHKSRHSDAGSRDVVNKKPHIKKPHSGPPRSKKEAERLLREAKGFAADMNWAEARVRYRWLVSSKFLQQAGYLGLADIAFQEKNGSLAISYAKKAGNGIKARMALGNGYFQNQDYKSALRIYDAILKKSPNHTEAQSHAKEARKRLGRKK